MNHQARQFDNKKGTLQRPCKPVPACLARWPEKGQAITTADHPIIANDFYCFLNGNKLTETDEEGRVTTWTYDLQNRAKTVSNPLLNVMSYNYDGENNKTRQTDWRGNDTTYDYDADNRLITQTQLTSKITRYSYDPVDNLLSEQDPEGRITTFAYDALNRQTSITDALGQTQTSTYDGMKEKGSSIILTESKEVGPS